MASQVGSNRRVYHGSCGTERGAQGILKAQLTAGSPTLIRHAKRKLFQICPARKVLHVLSRSPGVDFGALSISAMIDGHVVRRFSWLYFL